MVDESFLLGDVELFVVQTEKLVLPVVVPTKRVPDPKTAHCYFLHPVLLLLEHILRVFHCPSSHEQHFNQSDHYSQTDIYSGPEDYHHCTA